MTKDGRLIETDKVAMGVWKRLTSEFATWKMLILAGLSSRTWAQYSNDHLTPMLKASHWKIGLGLLGGLTDRQVEFLRELRGSMPSGSSGNSAQRRPSSSRFPSVFSWR